MKTLLILSMLLISIGVKSQNMDYAFCKIRCMNTESIMMYNETMYYKTHINKYRLAFNKILPFYKRQRDTLYVDSMLTFHHKKVKLKRTGNY
jgi:hypothetical protein